jgi:hypothetical protein
MAQASAIQGAKRAAKRVGATRREALALMMAGFVESGFEHDKYSRVGSGDRDSVGFLQQRPSQGWGPAGESPERDAQQFLAHARALTKKGFKGSAGELAQAVQRSAFPDRYDQARGRATAALGGAVGGTSAGSRPSWSEKSTFDREAFDTATKKARAGAFLAKRRPGSFLAKVLPQEAPDPADFTKTTQDFRPGQAPIASGRVDTAGQKSGTGKGRLRELFYDPGVNIDEDRRTKAIGGHSDHVHVALSDPKDREWAEKLARQMGLTVTSEGGGKHTEGSFHYQTLKGGESAALDVGGDPQKMLAYDRLVARRFRRGRR